MILNIRATDPSSIGQRSNNLSDFKKTIIDLLKFRDDRDWKQFHSLNNLITALSIEVAELAELGLWSNDVEMKEKLKNKKFHESFQDECADIFHYLLLIADYAEIDLLEASKSKIKKNDAKYPISKAFGKSTKYTNLDD